MYRKKIRFVLFSVFIIFSAAKSSGDVNSDEFNLENEMAAPTTEKPLENESNELINSSTNDQFQQDTDPSQNNLPEPNVNTNLASPLEVLQYDNALYGFSMGLIYSQAPIRENYKTFVPKEGKTIEIDRQSADLSNVGLIIRYAIVPFNKIGADINISFLKSQNHSGVAFEETKAFSEVSTIRAECNLTYAFSIGKALPLYFLLGAGYQQINGAAIEQKLNKNGYGGQVGGGLVLFSTLNVEGLYSYYTHKISNDLIELNKAVAKSYDKTSDDETDRGKITNQGFVIRTTYSFK